MSEGSQHPAVVLNCSANDVDEASSLLWEAGCLGVEERDGQTLVQSPAPSFVTLVAHFADEADALDALDTLGKRWEMQLYWIAQESWQDQWKAYFKTTQVSPRLIIRPSWEPAPQTGSAQVITLDPGAAFGTGTHESTRLVLRIIDQSIGKGMRVLDVGCGSGILSIAALLLGAKTATGLDIDPTAVAVALENAQLNSVAERFSASTQTLSAHRSENNAYDFVLANIELPVLLNMHADLQRSVARDGFLVLSGLLHGQEKPLIEALTEMKFVCRLELGEWVAALLTKV